MNTFANIDQNKLATAKQVYGVACHFANIHAASPSERYGLTKVFNAILNKFYGDQDAHMTHGEVTDFREHQVVPAQFLELVQKPKKKPKAAKKVKAKVEPKVEVIKEVPVEKVVIKEVVKEVPIEKVVEKEVYITDDEQVKELGGKVAKLDEEKTELLSTIEKLENEMSKSSLEIDELKQKFSTKEGEIESIKREFSTITTEKENIFQNEMSKKVEELDELRQTLDELKSKPEVPVDNTKTKMLETTLQNLRKDLSLKNTKITELEGKIKQLESVNRNVEAIYLKGSNLKQNL